MRDFGALSCKRVSPKQPLNSAKIVLVFEFLGRMDMICSINSQAVSPFPKNFGGLLKPITLKPVSRIFRIFRVFVSAFSAFSAFSGVLLGLVFVG